jgi:E3 ubiquitin-protein ligase TRIP12
LKLLPLPTAMTCTHYLKLPDYENLDMLRSKLMQSIQQCESGFQLS